MVRYFYAWTPLVIVTAISVLSMPWLGLIALMVVTLVGLPLLALALLVAPYLLVRAIVRSARGATPPAVALPSREARRQLRPIL